MKKLISLLLAVMMLAALASVAAAEDGGGTTMYVYTKNGKPLQVRSSMSTDVDNVVGTLPYGAMVVTYGSPMPGWTYIEYGTAGSHYVMSRFLVRYKPAPFDPTQPTAKPSGEFDTRSATTVEQINTLLASARSVEPYYVTVRPVRSSGWVYLRWLPTRHSTQIATYGANQRLTVIAELKDWYQVEDPNNGKVGFIYKSYIQ